MHMKRKITSKLCEWKNMLNGRMPLLIYGARQVGKTYEMKQMKKSEDILKLIFMQIM